VAGQPCDRQGVGQRWGAGAQAPGTHDHPFRLLPGSRGVAWGRGAWHPTGRQWMTPACGDTAGGWGMMSDRAGSLGPDRCVPGERGRGLEARQPARRPRPACSRPWRWWAQSEHCGFSPATVPAMTPPHRSTTARCPTDVMLTPGRPAPTTRGPGGSAGCWGAYSTFWGSASAPFQGRLAKGTHVRILWWHVIGRNHRRHHERHSVARGPRGRPRRSVERGDGRTGGRDRRGHPRRRLGGLRHPLAGALGGLALRRVAGPGAAPGADGAGTRCLAGDEPAVPGG
jgi:hypothetical protein